MSVPLLDVNAQNHPLEAEFTAAFQRVFQSGVFIGGPEVTALEDEIAKFAGAKHAIGVSSGTDAILVALMALGIGPGDEVICPAFTFFATAGCVSRVGAVPVFADVCPVCFNLDVSDARRKITSRTKAIIPVHLFGQSADMDGIMSLAKEHGLRVIEDAAQAMGATHHGHGCGTMGDFGTYSFFPSKNLGGMGDSGLVVTGDEDLSAKTRALRNHGMEPKYYHTRIGGNFRIDALQAALLRVKLPHYGEYTTRRRANAEYYMKELSSIPHTAIASEAHCGDASTQRASFASEGVKLVLPVALKNCGHIWNQYTLRVLGTGLRDALRDHLAARKIGCEIYYPLTLDRQQCFAYLPESSRCGCEISHQLAHEVLSLPVYPELMETQRAEVVTAIAEFFQSSES